MTTLVLEIRIAAPIEVCFDVARDVDVHLRGAADTQERAVAGKTSGLLGLGDEVTFEAVHFGVRQRHRSRIVLCDRPRSFTDEMVSGTFASFRHLHEFIAEGDAVLMRDTVTWRSPLGPLGVVADRWFVERHLREFLTRRQAELKRCAEERAKGAG
jgi:ligand-binding SRPBCC domain-containing protein